MSEQEEVKEEPKVSESPSAPETNSPPPKTENVSRIGGREFKPGSERFGYGKKDLEESTTLYIGDLDPSGSETKLRERLEKFGPIVSLKTGTAKSRAKLHPGYAFVEYENRADAEEAFKQLKGSEIDGLKIRVDWDLKHEKKQPRRRTFAPRRYFRPRRYSPDRSRYYRPRYRYHSPPRYYRDRSPPRDRRYSRDNERRRSPPRDRRRSPERSYDRERRDDHRDDRREDRDREYSRRSNERRDRRDEDRKRYESPKRERFSPKRDRDRDYERREEGRDRYSPEHRETRKRSRSPYSRSPSPDLRHRSKKQKI